MDFKNKVAIVTGAGQGIGFEICRSLAKEGARVILNDIDPGTWQNRQLIRLIRKIKMPA